MFTFEKVDFLNLDDTNNNQATNDIDRPRTAAHDANEEIDESENRKEIRTKRASALAATAPFHDDIRAQEDFLSKKRSKKKKK